jgi:hypothetical protein
MSHTFDPGPEPPPTELAPVKVASNGLVCRRQSTRFRARRGARAEVQKWGRTPGPDVALQLIDVSEGGVQVRLRVAVHAKELFEVTLRDPAGDRCAQPVTAVRWSRPEPDGTVVVGLEFAHVLRPDVVGGLAGPVSPGATPDLPPDPTCRPNPA